MSRKSKRTMVTEQVLEELYKQNNGLKLAIRMEELLHCSTGEDRILWNQIMNHIEFSYIVFSHYIKDGSDVVKYIVMSTSGVIATQSVNDYISKLLSV